MTIQEAFKSICSAVPQRQRAALQGQIKKISNLLSQVCAVDEVDPEKSIKLKRARIKATWPDGEEIDTDDLAVVAKRLRKSPNTLQAYLTRGGGKTKFEDPLTQEVVLVEKYGLEKAISYEYFEWFCVEHFEEKFPDGNYTLEAIACWLNKTPRAVRRLMTEHGDALSLTFNEQLCELRRLESRKPVEFSEPPINRLTGKPHQPVGKTAWNALKKD